MISVRDLSPEDVPRCEAILRSLPDWFGIEESNVQYIRDLDSLPTLVATIDDHVVGFLALKHHNDVSTEIHIVAVSLDRHRQGIGRALLQSAESIARDRGTQLLQVKTLGPSEPDPNYERTRAFYAAMGYLPLEETTAFWGEENPTIILVKPL